MSIVNHPQHFQRLANSQSSNRPFAARAFRSSDQRITSIRRISTVLFTFAFLAVVFAGIIALRAAVWLHAFHY